MIFIQRKNKKVGENPKGIHTMENEINLTNQHLAITKFFVTFSFHLSDDAVTIIKKKKKK